MDNEIMTVNEVAEFLRMNPMTIYRMAQQGRIPASKIWGCWRFQRSEIESWVKAQEYQTSRLLVIDDDPAMGATIREFLGKSHTVVAAETGQAALQTLNKDKFNLIFLDLGLPDTDGISLYRQIKALGKNIPVVIITGLQDPATLTQAVAEGAQFILNKPFTAEEIRQMINFIKV